jgi:hypothetical protein
VGEESLMLTQKSKALYLRYSNGHSDSSQQVEIALSRCYDSIHTSRAEHYLAQRLQSFREEKYFFLFFFLQLKHNLQLM